MVYFRRLVSDLDPGAVDGPSEIGTDNKGARDVAYNPEHHGRMKHVERRHFFVRDMVEKFEIRVPWILPTPQTRLTRGRTAVLAQAKHRIALPRDRPRAPPGSGADHF